MERQPGRRLPFSSSSRRETMSDALSFRILLAADPFPLHRSLDLGRSPVGIASAPTRVVRLRHGPILTVSRTDFDVRRDVRRIRALTDFPEPMNRSTKRFLLNGEEGKGAYRIRTRATAERSRQAGLR